jgi:hypothetical protein
MVAVANEKSCLLGRNATGSWDGVPTWLDPPLSKPLNRYEVGTAEYAVHLRLRGERFFLF